jgi:NAD(P)-dependent dehydrogenase (short-subunit alcohol dehydrogenase family)
MKSVTVLVGSGSIGVAIARRVSAGKHVVLADLRQENADAAAAVLTNAGFEVSTAAVDVSSREAVENLAEKASSLGDVTGVIHAAGVSPSQAPITAILKVDLYGTALILEVFGNVIARGGSGVVIASQSGHRLGCPVGRAGTPDEVANVAALLMGPDGAFITGSDILMDGGVTASFFFGELASK